MVARRRAAEVSNLRRAPEELSGLLVRLQPRPGETTKPSFRLQGESVSGMVITFSGLDGAGKTTLIAELTRELELRGWAVTR